MNDLMEELALHGENQILYYNACIGTICVLKKPMYLNLDS